MYKVLIVDDEEIIRRSFRKLVNWNKYNLELVNELSNGLEALDYMINNPVDILISDIKMPVLDGIGLLNELKFRNILPMGIIMLSAFDEYELIRSSFKLGADDYILKSDYDEDDIIKVVLNLLEKKSQNTETIIEDSPKCSYEVNQVVDFIKKNYHNNLTLKDISQRVSYSESYLSHLISKELDMTFIEFLNTIRIDRAKELLSTTNLKIYEISEKVGFQSVEYFSRYFKKLTGKSPKQFRQLYDANLK